MIEQEKGFDVEKTISDLQELGVDLQGLIFQLPESTIKRYLLLETSKIIELKEVFDFCYLQSKLNLMKDLILQGELDGDRFVGEREILEALEEMEEGVKKVVQYVKDM
jgi:hypothetical protein